jgi:hypothetical protein
MKPILCTSLFVMVLVSAHRFAGTNTLADNKINPITDKHAIMKFDTFYAVRILCGGNPPKTMARDTIVLVMHNLPTTPTKRAVTRYSFEMIPYNPFDSGAPSKSAARDTLTWTAKPYRP